ncbi:DUF2007 domain-containing protein [Leptobacterium flavescens]|uniref:DUF2007 domain-containing protein n=1 Tax=Leptobacterium flavescens TaxID=472055 RepID=A0A6P0UNA2_9FLAO|nr:DUF2007 domain-containing protein [Leptobacterium flavescens]NER14507.1 DUF2007 domain-containing protein [Leptobacterium flavescens]
MKDSFYTLATFEYTADAQILKGKLESESIYVYLKDEHTLDSDPLISNAIGGVKLQVKDEDKERAMEIYENIRQYTEDLEGNPIVCGNCGESKMLPYHNTRNIFYKLFPFFERRKYICTQCNHVNRS